MNKKGQFWWGIIILLLIIGGIAWTIWQWKLCRNAGLPFWYCIQHIS